MYHRDPEVCRDLREAGVRCPRGIVAAAVRAPRYLGVISFVLEMLAGSASFSKAAACCGYVVVALDRASGPDHDLSKPKTLDMVLRWIQAGLVVFTLLGPPCQSWSRACCNPARPQMVRNVEELCGPKVLRYDSERWNLVNGI